MPSDGARLQCCICLEEDRVLLKSKNCECKSALYHKDCLNEWFKEATTDGLSKRLRNTFLSCVFCRKSFLIPTRITPPPKEEKIRMSLIITIILMLLIRHKYIVDEGYIHRACVIFVIFVIGFLITWFIYKVYDLIGIYIDLSQSDLYMIIADRYEL